MDYQSLHIKTVVELRGLAREMGVRVPAGTNKDLLIDMLLTADRHAAEAAKADKPAAPRKRGRPRKDDAPENLPAAEKPAKPRKAGPAKQEEA